ncbi:hypothetical protein MOO46_06010 [Apilactobacillus apisilvae]|uniref:Uncharacterized protein n=1 Tax=Apilactobacillus apisilvae TaxID=2923364 RepID=A0ABY4PG63_9LACO|nr:hypothetical protein [Apilactobacillus apisilvae]UQS84798.1 hypothetical protein MOO46_06010 [Apilactobacillus apisilvae]
MISHKKSILKLNISILFALLLFFGINVNSAQAKYKGHHQTPTELRGNWYAWNKHTKKFDHMHIYKYSVYFNQKRLYAKNNKSYMYVIKHKKGSSKYGKQHGFGGTNYTFYRSFTMGDAKAYWLSHRKIHGRRVLKTYKDSLGFNIYNRTKIKHDYSYNYTEYNYMSKIGR